MSSTFSSFMSFRTIVSAFISPEAQAQRTPPHCIALFHPRTWSGFETIGRQFPKLNLVERDTGCICARFVAGRLLWIDADVLAGASIDAETHAARYAAAPEIFSVPWPRHGLT